MRILLQIWRPFLLLVVVVALGCKSAQPIPLDSNYLATETECTSGPLAHEKDQGFTILKDFLREGWKRENRARADVVLTGDSTIALFMQPRIEAYLPGRDVANRAIGGETSVGLLSRIEQDVVPLRPRVIVFAIGGNDILGGRCLRDSLDATRTIIAGLKKNLPGVRIVVVSVPPVILERANLVSPYYNKKLEFLSSDLGVQFLDLWPVLSDGRELKRDYWYELPNGKYDRVHFNEKGYEAFGRALQPFLR
jgi:lysophospholipase L1-like esterase